MEYIFYDAAVVAVLALFLWRGWRKGLLLSLCGLAVVAVSFLGAGFIADTLDAPLAGAIAPKLEETIQVALEKKAEELGVEGVFPDSDAADALREMGGLYTWAAEVVEDALGQSLTQTVSQQAAAAADAVALKLAHTAVFALSFVLLVILLTLLLHVLNVVAKLPGLHFCNGLGGGVIGLVKGVIVLYVVLVCLRLFGGVITPEVEENTCILRFFLRFDPVSTLFGG